MDEFTKARLRLFTVLLLFVIFVFCLIFGSVKICRQFNPAEKKTEKKSVKIMENQAVPQMEEPQFNIQPHKKSPHYFCNCVSLIL